MWRRSGKIPCRHMCTGASGGKFERHYKIGLAASRAEAGHSGQSRFPMNTDPFALRGDDPCNMHARACTIIYAYSRFTYIYI